MKKFALFLVVVLFIAAGYAGYLFFFKSYDTADQEVDQLADEQYEINLPDSSGPEEGKSEPTQDQIVQSYQSSYQSLMASAEERVNQLASQAQGEYMSKRQNGEDVSYSYFFNKYNSAADRLEETTDQAFERIYKDMNQSLETHDYATAEADQLQQDYEQTKKQWRTTLLQKVKESL